MKIAAKTIEAFLSQLPPTCRGALFYGPDAGLVRERAQRVKTAILGASFDPMAVVEWEEAKLLADPALLADEFAAVSLMAPRRVILIRDAGDKLTKIFESALPYAHAEVFLVAMAGELSARSTLRLWFEKEKDVASVACYKDEARDVEQVIRKRFAEAEIRADRDVVAYLSGQLGNDRGVTHQELDKIITYAGEEKTLYIEDIQALVGYNRDTDVDDVVSAVADKNLAALEAALSRLLREGVQPVTYLRGLQRYFNRLYAMRTLMDNGQSAGEIIASARPPVFFKQVPVMTRHLQAWSLSSIVKALALLIEAELACKTSDLPPAPASHRKLMQVTQAR